MARSPLLFVLLLGAMFAGIGCGEDAEKQASPSATSAETATAERTEIDPVETEPRTEKETRADEERTGTESRSERAAARERRARRRSRRRSREQRDGAPRTFRAPRPQDPRVERIGRCIKRERAKRPDAQGVNPEAFRRCLKVSRSALRRQFLRGCRTLARRNKDKKALRRCPAQAREFLERAAGR